MLLRPFCPSGSCFRVKRHAVCHRRWQKADAKTTRRLPLLCADVLGEVVHLADQLLNRITAPDFQSALQRTELTGCVVARIFRSKRVEELHVRSDRDRPPGMGAVAPSAFQKGRVADGYVALTIAGNAVVRFRLRELARPRARVVLGWSTPPVGLDGSGRDTGREARRTAPWHSCSVGPQAGALSAARSR